MGKYFLIDNLKILKTIKLMLIKDNKFGQLGLSDDKLNDS